MLIPFNLLSDNYCESELPINTLVFNTTPPMYRHILKNGRFKRTIQTKTMDSFRVSMNNKKSFYPSNIKYFQKKKNWTYWCLMLSCRGWDSSACPLTYYKQWEHESRSYVMHFKCRNGITPNVDWTRVRKSVIPLQCSKRILFFVFTWRNHRMRSEYCNGITLISELLFNCFVL